MDEPSRNGSRPGDEADKQTPWERFERLARQVVRVPKSDIDEKREQEKHRRAKKRTAA